MLLDIIFESFVADKFARDFHELPHTNLGLQQNTAIPKNCINTILAKYPHNIPREDSRLRTQKVIGDMLCFQHNSTACALVVKNSITTLALSYGLCLLFMSFT